MSEWSLTSTNTDPSIVKDLPSGWTIESLASIFEDVEVKGHPGRGIGLFAKTSFRKGEEILVEEAILWQEGPSDTSPPVIPSKHMDGGDEMITAFLYQFAPYGLRPHSDVSSVQKPKNRLELLNAVLKYCSTGVGAPAADSNPVFIQRTGARALFPMLATLNHSCDPNVVTYQAEPIEFSESEPPRYVIRARKDIIAGDELVVSYVPPTWHKHIRQKALQDRWHFTCTCRRCSVEYDDTIITRCAACTVPATETSYAQSGRVYWKASACIDCGAPANVDDTPAARADNDKEMLWKIFEGGRPSELVDFLLNHPVLCPSDTRIIFAGLNLLGMLSPAPELQEKLREGLRRGIEGTPYATLADFNLEREPTMTTGDDPETSEPTLPV